MSARDNGFFPFYHEKNESITPVSIVPKHAEILVCPYLEFTKTHALIHPHLCVCNAYT